MLSRLQRLSTEQLLVVIEKGRVVHSPLFVLRVLPSTGATRIAAIAPKKFAKTAVSRNKIRRSIYNAVRPIFPTINKSVHVAIFAKPEILKADSANIASGVKDVFVKAGLLK